MRSEQQLAFVREMSVLSQAKMSEVTKTTELILKYAVPH